MADDYSGNMNTGGVLLVGGSVQGSFETDSDRDAFKVRLLAGETVQFSVAGAAAGGGTLSATAAHRQPVSLAIIDPANQFASSGNFYTGDGGKLVSAPFTATVDGDYYVYLDTRLVGTYTLSAALAAAPDDVLDTPATGVQLQLGQTASGTIGAYNDRDYFSARMEPAAAYRFDIKILDASQGPLSIYGMVYEKHTTQDYQFTYVSSGNINPYLYVTSASGSGSYSVSYTKLPDDIGATASSSAVLPIGAGVSASGDFDGDVDWFRVDLLGGVGYKFTAQASSGIAPSLSIVLPGNTSPSGAVAISPFFSAPTSGTYYVAAAAFGASSYTVNAALAPDDFGNTAADAGRLVPGTAQAGKFEVNNDRDAFRMAVEAGRFYKIVQVIQPNLNPGERIATGLTGLDGLASPSSHLAISGLTTTYTFKAVGSGEILYRNGYSVPAAYTLTASALDFDDIGESSATAAALVVGASASGRLQVAGDKDWFQVDLEAGVSYVFEGTAANGASITVLSSSGGQSQSGKSWLTPAVSGKHYVYVSSGSAGIDYTVKAGLATDDFGANPSAAGALAIGATAAGQINSIGDRDWYAVALNAGQTYWFDAAFPIVSSGAPGLRIANSAGVVQAEAPLFTGSTTLSFAPSASGTYYLEAGAQADRTAPVGAYTVSARFGTADDFVLPGVLTLGVATAGKLEVRGDSDSFGVELQAGSYYRVTGTMSDSQGKALTGALPALIAPGESAAAVTVTGNVFQAPVSGRYATTFEGGKLGAGAQYTLRLDLIAADDHVAGTPARTAVMGQRIGGTVEVAGDQDSFKLAVQAGQKLKVTLLGSASGGGTLDIASGSALLTVRSGTNAVTPVWSLAGADGTLAAAYVLSGSEAEIIVSSSLATGSYSLEFAQVTGDTIAPTLVSPASNNPTLINFNSNLPVLLSEPFLRQGLLVLNNQNNQLVENFSLNPFGAAKISIDGNGFTINPATHLIPGATYTLQFPASSIYDHAYNALPATSVKFVVAISDAATAGNDVFAGTVSGRTIDGGAGHDVVVFSGNFTSYAFKAQAGGATAVSRTSSGTLSDSLVNIERVYFERGDAMALDTGATGIGGMAYRLYQAAFDRIPDKAGVGFWMSAMDQGLSLRDVAGLFVGSAEFKAVYGADSSNSEFIARLYSNVLNRPGEQAGIDYWVQALESGYSRADTLANFSEGLENTAAVALVIGNGFGYIPYG